MPVLHEVIETTLARAEAFAFIADFANAPAWDPGTATSVRIDPGPVAVGSRYALGVRMRGRIAPMEYRITILDPLARVVMAGAGSGVRATDDISFADSGHIPGGTRIDYVAEIHLGGWMRLLEPFVGGAFAAIARDARDGMRRTLDERAKAQLPSTPVEAGASPVPPEPA